MLKPDSLFKKSWDILVFFLTVGAFVVIPLSLVFPVFDPVVLGYGSLGLSGVFLIDIFLLFSTAIRRAGRLESRFSAVASGYIKGSFFFDFIAVFPFLYVASILFPGKSGGISGPLMLLTLNPLFKIVRAGGILKRIGGTRINPAILRLLLLLFWILLAAHLISCSWILVSGNPEGLGPFDRYVAAFYWTVTTLVTIGYGDITPKGTYQMIFVIFVEFFGAGMYALIIGNIANLIANIDIAKTQYRENLDKINAFMKYRNLPQPLQKRVVEYYEYLWDTRRGNDELSVLGYLPTSLRQQVALYLNRDIIARVPIFEKADANLLRDVIVNLKPVVYTPGDIIVYAGELGMDMYFISRGSVEVLSPDEKTSYAVLGEGQFFGEIALLLSMPRTATIKAREYCDLYRLDKNTFDVVLSGHPDFRKEIGTMAAKRRLEIDALRAKRAEESSSAESERPPSDPTVPAVKVMKRESSLLLIWNDIEGADRYEVARLNPGTGKWRIEVSNLVRPVHILDAFRTSSTYRVRAILSSGEGPWSKAVKPSED